MVAHDAHRWKFVWDHSQPPKLSDSVVTLEPCDLYAGNTGGLLRPVWYQLASILDGGLEDLLQEIANPPSERDLVQPSVN